MDKKAGDLALVDETTDHAIRAGIEAEGFGEYYVSAVDIRERLGVVGSRVFRFSLTFTQEAALDHESEAFSNIDQLVYLGRRFAKDFQLKVSALLPNIRIGHKVILSVEEYEELRRKAMTNYASPL